MVEAHTQTLIELIVPILVALLASSGFWVFIGQRKDRKSLQTELLIGLAHDRIIFLGMKYISRGWVSQDEFENLHTYLYRPYELLGGNGSAKKIMDEVTRLPIKSYGDRPNNISQSGDD